MSIITAWRLAECPCGHADFRTFFTPPTDCTCRGCGLTREAESFVDSFRAHVPSTARKRFAPHFNRSLGRFVESPEHLKHFQQVFGCEDAELGKVRSDGAPDFVPRDFETTGRKAAEFAQSCDQYFEDPGGEPSAIEIAPS